MAIHVIIPTNVKLHTTRLMDTENYTQGGRLDTITTSTHKMRGETGDLGIDLHTCSSYTKKGPETYTPGMDPSPPFENIDPTDIRRTCDCWRMCFFFCGESTQDLIGNRLQRLHASEEVVYQEKNIRQLVVNYLEVF